MDRAELLQRYAAGERNFSGADLTGIQLNSSQEQEINLSGVNLRGANLSEAHLVQVNLSNADLSNSFLNRANLEKANLSGAELRGVNAYNANLTQANLSHAYLLGANLTEATLYHANLQNANLTDAILQEADVTNADFNGANLTGMQLLGTDVTSALNASGSASIFFNSADNPNLELLNAIRQASQGLRHRSEMAYPYEVFLWEVATRGAFTLEGLFQVFGHLRAIALDEFRNGDFNSWEWLQPISNQYTLSAAQQTIQAFRTLTEQLEPYLSNLEVYRLVPYDQDLFILLFLFGATQAGDWVGVSTKISSVCEQQHYSLPIFRVRDMALARPENQEAITSLESAITGITFEYELECFVWEIAEQRSDMIQNLLDTTKILTIDELEDWFFDRYEGDEDYEQGKTLATLVKSNLTNLRVYRLNPTEIDVYVVGQTENGDWIGIHTQAVET